MENLTKWMRKKAEKASEVIELLSGDRPGVDFLWEQGESKKYVSPVVLIFRLPFPGSWNSREVVRSAIQFLQLLGGAFQVNGDKEAADMFYTFITVCEMALEKDKESRNGCC